MLGNQIIAPICSAPAGASSLDFSLLPLPLPPLLEAVQSHLLCAAPAGGNPTGRCARTTVNTHTAGLTGVGLPLWGRHGLEMQNSLANCKWGVEKKTNSLTLKKYSGTVYKFNGNVSNFVLKPNSAMIIVDVCFTSGVKVLAGHMTNLLCTGWGEEKTIWQAQRWLRKSKNEFIKQNTWENAAERALQFLNVLKSWGERYKRAVCPFQPFAAVRGGHRWQWPSWRHSLGDRMIEWDNATNFLNFWLYMQP